jgi:hypothetical protein
MYETPGTRSDGEHTDRRARARARAGLLRPMLPKGLMGTGHRLYSASWNTLRACTRARRQLRPERSPVQLNYRRRACARACASTRVYVQLVTDANS